VLYIYIYIYIYMYDISSLRVNTLVKFHVFSSKNPIVNFDNIKWVKEDFYYRVGLLIFKVMGSRNRILVNF
jgi:hypothetical protein